MFLGTEKRESEDKLNLHKQRLIMKRLIMKTGKEIACLGCDCIPLSLFKYS